MPSRLLLALLSAPLLAVPAATAAQDGFLFGLPQTSLSLRAGHARPAVTGDLFDSMRQRLTVDSSDFGSETVVGELLVGVSPHLELGAGLGWANSTVASEFRDYTYQDDSPIEQVTKLRRVPFTVLARLYPLARGKALSNYAYIPARFTPFVGGGAGIVWYKLEQAGDFVDAETLDIFEGNYESAGTAFAAHALGGAEYWVTARLGVVAEGRYTWATTTPHSQFEFDKLDLGGWQATAGIAIRL